GCGSIARIARHAQTKRSPGRNSFPHLARAGDCREALHARRHHCARQTGARGVHGRTAGERHARRTVPAGGGRRSIRAAKIELAGGRTVNWEQLKAILWLRWRLSKNQFARAGQLNAVLSVLLLVFMLLLSAGLLIAAVSLGAFAAPKIPPQVLLLIWDGVIFGFLIFWLSGLMIEIQRSESIDLTKLLHLPVTLHQVFIFN